jgi:hypothetical protein
MSPELVLVREPMIASVSAAAARTAAASGSLHKASMRWTTDSGTATPARACFDRGALAQCDQRAERGASGVPPVLVAPAVAVTSVVEERGHQRLGGPLIGASGQFYCRRFADAGLLVAQSRDKRLQGCACSKCPQHLQRCPADYWVERSSQEYSWSFPVE